jgi:thymidylate synthase (FAD)
MKVEAVNVTPNAESQIAYCARVSNPNNQDREDITKLLKYCIDHQHWSIFEQAFLTVEINTTRGLAAQILRHRSFTFQEFSQRYADTNLLGDTIPMFDLRSQDNKNRQNSTDDVSAGAKRVWQSKIEAHFKESLRLYNEMLGEGIAKECARFVLPLATPTRLYMSGSVRSFIHYIDLRSGNGTQKEHRDIAEECKKIFTHHFPIIAKALNYVE